MSAAILLAQTHGQFRDDSGRNLTCLHGLGEKRHEAESRLDSALAPSK